MIFNPVKKLHALLLQRDLSFSCAESCTGGLISKKITDNAGSSKYFLGSVISYAEEIKMKTLSVPRDILHKHGAVSAETALAMAERVKKLMDSDVSMAVTGIAGPGGGSPSKPVGTVFIAYALPHDIIVEKHQFKGNRAAIRNRTARMAIKRLYQLLS